MKVSYKKLWILCAEKEISKVEMNAPVAIGDIVIENCAGTGVDVIATKNVSLVG